MTWKSMTLTGWGRALASPALVARPESASALERAALDGTGDGAGCLARGGGRSYGDAALNRGGRVVLLGRMDRLLSFDPDTGLLEAEAGATFADLLDTFLPRGWLVPVTPGTGFVTLGGAVAADVHGKNHDSAGSFGDHVEALTLLAADGRRLRLTPPDPLFAATVGGMGLTGVIETVALRLMRVPSAAMAVREDRARDLDELMARLSAVRDTTPYTVAWVDGVARGRRLGRGVVEAGRHAEAARGAADHRPRRLSVPLDAPSFLLSPPVVAAFNEAYWRRIPAAGRQRTTPAARFLYPLDAIGGWNRLYGRAGFHQFQCVLPEAHSPAGLARLLQAISAARSASFLAVLKTMGGEGRGLLSFPMRGWTLALDFPARPGTGELLARLEAITLDHGGRVYLAKDSSLSPEALPRMYPKLAEFRRLAAEIDPHGHWQSDLSRRLRLKGEA